MTRVWFSQPLETVAMFWRILRKDGVALGFTTHDRDLWIDGLCYRAAPGMVPSAIRCSADLEADSAEVEGVLSHDSIAAGDLALGRFDGARVVIGLVDWETGEHHPVYRGSIGAVTEETGRFTAQLASRKAELLCDPIPRTSPTCRAEFCGPGCTLSAARFTHEAHLSAVDSAQNTVRVADLADPTRFVFGTLRFGDGVMTGIAMRVIGLVADALVLDAPLDHVPAPGTRLTLREGCDRTLATCASRFANAVNFQGEPFLPGNDLIARYPVGA